MGYDTQTFNMCLKNEHVHNVVHNITVKIKIIHLTKTKTYTFEL